VCVSDTVALGAWTEITARGLAPGLDVAVIGFDDSTAAAAVGLTAWRSRWTRWPTPAWSHWTGSSPR